MRRLCLRPMLNLRFMVSLALSERVMVRLRYPGVETPGYGLKSLRDDCAFTFARTLINRPYGTVRPNTMPRREEDD
jgi:hypothetical protein